jgi:hypothetical protein
MLPFFFLGNQNSWGFSGDVSDHLVATVLNFLEGTHGLGPAAEIKEWTGVQRLADIGKSEMSQ